MANVVNILELYRLAFGYVGKPPYNKGDLNRIVDIPGTYNDAEVTLPQAQKFSLLGVPFYMPLKLDGFEFPLEPIIEINGGKKIIETELDGFEPGTGGTQKEEFHLMDYDVTITGVVMAEDDYPEEQVREIRAIAEKPGAVSVTNRLCTIFGIEKLVIYKSEFAAIPGVLESQGIRLTCKSDKDFDLLLNG